MPRYGMWAEPRDYGSIKHVEGCLNSNGCRCAAYEGLNPRDTLPPDLRGEVEAIEAEIEQMRQRNSVPGPASNEVDE